VRRPVFVLLALALLAAGCSDSGPSAAPAPSTVVEETTTEPPTTATSTTLKPTTTTTGVPRTTVTTLLAMGPGDAALTGTVSGPAGPVDGAVVRVERLVGKAVVTADVTTSGGGAWQLTSILGGSYRVRAFKTPDLAPSPVEAFFLGATERRNLEFKLTAAGGERITAVVNPSPPRVEQPATITVTVGVGAVDDQGRSVLTPRPGVLLVLSETPGLLLQSAQAALTDGTGSASWGFRCTVEGANTFVLTINNGSTRVTFPACAPAGPTTTAKRG
jgi:hypothetical protein